MIINVAIYDSRMGVTVGGKRYRELHHSCWTSIVNDGEGNKNGEDTYVLAVMVSCYSL